MGIFGSCSSRDYICCSQNCIGVGLDQSLSCCKKPTVGGVRSKDERAPTTDPAQELKPVPELAALRQKERDCKIAMDKWKKERREREKNEQAN